MLGRYIAITLIGLGGAMLLAPDAPDRAVAPLAAPTPVAPTPEPVAAPAVDEAPRAPSQSAGFTPLETGDAGTTGAAEADETLPAFLSAPPGSAADGPVESAEAEALGSDALAVSLLGSLADDSILPTLGAPDTVQSLSVGADTLALISLVESGAEAEGAADADAAPEVAEAQAGAAPDDTTRLYVTGSRVNVRSGPSTGFSVISSVAFGDAVELLDETGDGWAEIRIADGSTGFMARRFLEE